MKNKTIEELRVKVTYEVGLGGLEVPPNIYKQLKEMFENSDSVEMGDHHKDTPISWLLANIKEADCCEWEAEILDFE